MLKKILAAAAVASVAIGSLAAVPASAQSYYQQDGYNRSYDYRQAARYRDFERHRRWEQYRHYQHEREAQYGRGYDYRYYHNDGGGRYWDHDHHDDRGEWGR